ncbi:hypothetical protein HPB50_016991 [Hyalomma asiaticum]|uniref:Uncharacterized protein n=1 Tax=Hyalomma asiaticum TaxID=266040 RepID=A0ACB7S0T0_HYAAI|nr:hypothetical protein HPB50_016991 [Hyalomma asiaticum]
MSAETLEYRLKILDNNGYHLVYPHGIKFQDPKSYFAGLLSKPLFHGCTFRVLFYAQKISDETEIKIALDGVNSDTRFIRIYVNNKGKVVTSGKDKGGAFNADVGVPDVKQGDYYTLAIRYENRNFYRTLFDTNKGKGQADKRREMEDAQEVKRWHMKIMPGSHYVLSIHVSDEMNMFPADGLDNEYELDAFGLDVGSFGIFEMKYTGTDGMLMVSFSVPNGIDKFTTFRKTPLKPGEDFLVYIRTAPTGWLVQTSFQDAAALVLRPAGHLRISPKFSSAVIMRMYLVSDIKIACGIRAGRPPG